MMLFIIGKKKFSPQKVIWIIPSLELSSYFAYLTKPRAYDRKKRGKGMATGTGWKIERNFYSSLPPEWDSIPRWWIIGGTRPTISKLKGFVSSLPTPPPPPTTIDRLIMFVAQGAGLLANYGGSLKLVLKHTFPELPYEGSII